MTTATLTAKGQATIPKTVCNHFGLKNGDKLDFIIGMDGSVTIRPVNGDALSLAGLLADRYAPVSIEEMDCAIVEQVSRETQRLSAHAASSEDAMPLAGSAIEYLLSLPAGDNTRKPLWHESSMNATSGRNIGWAEQLYREAQQTQNTTKNK